MTITLDLTPDVQERAVVQARTEGIAVERYLQALIETALPTEQAEPVRRRNHECNAAALALLDAFLEDDAQDQRETLQFLRNAIDEDRPGQRRVFG